MKSKISSDILITGFLAKYIVMNEISTDLNMFP